MDKIIKIFFFILTLGVFFWLLFLAGCEPSHGPELMNDCDTKLTNSEIIAVNVIQYDTYRDVLNAFREINPDTELSNDTRMEGFATYKPRIQLHTLHIIKIRGQNDHERIETLGHELMHSYCVDWHPRVAGSH